MDKESRERALANLIAKAKQAYYFSGEEIMSDAEYDALEGELEEINPGHPILKTVGAPVEDGAGHLGRVRHRMMMGSQNKVNSGEEFEAWTARRAGGKNGKGYHCSIKADGCSIAAYYRKGRLEQVVTRGDGDVGEDVTSNAFSFKGLPVYLGQDLDCAVRLEAVLTIDDWKKVDPDGSSNPRSLANGILGRKDGKNANFLTALAFDVDLGEGGGAGDTEEAKSIWLEGNGFGTTDWKLVQDISEVGQFLRTKQDERDGAKMPYWADGIVVKINDLQTQKDLGVVSGRPKGQIAWKFSAEKASGTLLDVEWTVGHTGAVTPVAQVSPVRLGGTTVQRVSLANPELIGALGLKIGSEVELVKAGDIIPKITRVLKAGDGPDIATPCNCPECEAALSKMSNVDGSESTVIYCRNPECEAQASGRIRRWAKSRDVLGLGDSVIESLCSSGMVKSVPDLFALRPEDIQDLVINRDKKIRLGAKRAASICQEIAGKGREMSLPEFLGSFGTRKLGVRRAELMLQSNPELADLERWFDGSLSETAFAAKAGVPKAGAQILEGLREREDIIRRAAEHVSIVHKKPEENGNPPAICITGSLPSGKKKSEWEKPLRDAGYRLVDSVTKDLHALVVSDPGVVTGKSQKAAKMGVKIISEKELESLCRRNAGMEKEPEAKSPATPLPRAKASEAHGVTPGGAGKSQKAGR